MASRRRLAGWALVALALAGVAGGGVAWRRAHTIARIASRLAENESDPFEPGHLIPCVVESENAATLYEQAWRLTDPGGPMVQAALETATTPAVSAKDYLAARRALDRFMARNAGAIEKLERAQRLPSCAFVASSGKIRHGVYKPLGAVTEMLVLRVEIAVESDPAEAVRSLGLLFHLPHALDEDQCLASFEQRVVWRRAACHLVASALDSDPDEAGCERLLASIERSAAPDELARAIVGERCLRLELFDRMEELAYREVAGLEPKSLDGWDRAGDVQRFHDVTGQLLAIVRRNDSGMLSRCGLLAGSCSLPSNAVGSWHFLKDMLERPAELASEDEQTRACARVAVLLKLHRLRHGSYPVQLSELDPALRTRMPVDKRLWFVPYEQRPSGFRLGWRVQCRR